jgi:archaellum biogenesis protein FlaJ (TadC family)
MTQHHWVWFAYILTAVITLLSHMNSYIYHEALEHNKKWYKAMKEWIFEKTLANGAEWVGTVCVVWAFGYLFIEKVVGALGYFSAFFQALPVVVPIAALLGWAAETGAPKFCVWIVEKFTPRD